MIRWAPEQTELSADLRSLTNLTVGALLLEVRAREPLAEADSFQTLQNLNQAMGTDRLRLLHPFLFRFYNDYREQEASGKLRIQELFGAVWPRIELSRRRASRAIADVGLAVDIDAPELATSSTAARLNEMAARAAGRPVPLTMSTTGLAEHQRSILREACGVINRVWPDMRDELEHNIACLGFFEGEATIGAADFSCNGSIFLNVARVDDPVKLAEEIIHEASHVRLNVAMTCDCMIVNDPSELFETPLRQDRRPMFGLFHQIFVLMRLREFYLRCSDVLSSKYEPDVHNINALLEEGLDTVRKNGRFTPGGSALFTSMQESFHA